MNIGDVIVAHNTCRMDSGEETLTIGRGYKVETLSGKSFSIIDDKGHTHWYDFEGGSIYTRWFFPVGQEDYSIY